MNERLLETWLTRANERSFQIPFCHWLASNGHTVVHLSRHCAMEMGKDIITIDKDGVPCAFQLKGVEGGGKMSLSSWRDDLGRQINTLVMGKIVHPSIPQGSPRHRAFIVINGELEEEVSREIDDYNRGLSEAGIDRKLNVVLKGQLFQYFKELQTDFWASDIGDLKTYLELYLEDGRGPLPKEKAARLFEAALPFAQEGDKAPSRNEIIRAMAGCAILCASSISSFTKEENHLAEFEAWTMYHGYIIAVAEKWGLTAKQIKFAADLASQAMYSSLARLCDELERRENYGEGNVLADRFVYEVRMTQLLGLMGIYGLWHLVRVRQGIETVDERRIEFLRKFSRERSKALSLWGEFAIPQFLAHNFFCRTFDTTTAPDSLYLGLLKGIITKANESDSIGLFNPYYDAEDCLSHVWGLEADELNDSFRRTSFYAEGLLHLFVRSQRREEVKEVFPLLTKLGHLQYKPTQPWAFYFFRNRGGTNIQSFLKLPHTWDQLVEEASEDRGDDLPILVKENPIIYLALLCTYPHRVNSSGLRWLSSHLPQLV